MSDALPHYEGLKQSTRTLASGKTVTYYYDRKTNKPIKGEIGTDEFDRNYVLVTGRPSPLDKGTAPAVLKDSLQDIWNRYQADPEYKSLSDNSKHDIKKHIGTWLEIFGDKHVGEIRRAAIMEVRDIHADTPRTAKHKVQTISRLLSFARDREIVESNVASGVRVNIEPRDQIWQPEQLQTFIATANPWVSGVVILALLTGQRQDDCLTMQRAQVQGGYLTVKQGKTDAIVRLTLADNPDLERFLAAFQAFQPETEDGTVLTGQRGHAWTGSGFRAEMTKAKIACQSEAIEKLAFLDLRRTCVVEMALAGYPIRSIGQVTGHADNSILEILKVYLPRSVILAEQGARKARKRVRLVNGVGYQSPDLESLTDAWLRATGGLTAKEWGKRNAGAVVTV